MAYTLHWYKFWPDAMAARVALEEQQDQAQLVEVDMSTGANKDPKFLALNPAGEPPVLVDDTGPLDNGVPFSLWETMAVAQYLHDKRMRVGGANANPVLYPKDPEAYPLSVQWATWTQINLVPAVEQVLLNSLILPQAQRNLLALFVAAAQTMRALTFLETQVPSQANGPAFMNAKNGPGTFSFADITLGSTLTYAHKANQQMPLQNFPKLGAYLQMLESRPSFKSVFKGVTLP